MLQVQGSLKGGVKIETPNHKLDGIIVMPRERRGFLESVSLTRVVNWLEPSLLAHPYIDKF